MLLAEVISSPQPFLENVQCEKYRCQLFRYFVVGRSSFQCPISNAIWCFEKVLILVYGCPQLFLEWVLEKPFPLGNARYIT